MNIFEKDYGYCDGVNGHIIDEKTGLIDFGVNAHIMPTEFGG